MQQRVLDIRGNWNSKSFNDDYSSGRSIGVQDRLTSISSSNGNHISPRAHGFTKSTVNSWEGSITNVRKSDGKINYTRGTLGFAQAGIFTGLMPTNSAFNSALSAISEKLRGEIDLSIDFMQRKQTGAMMHGLQKMLVSIPDFLRNVKLHLKLLARNPRRASRQAAKAWLTWTYGIKPLMSTIWEAGRKLFNPDKPKGVWLWGKGYDSQQVDMVSGKCGSVDAHYKGRKFCAVTICGFYTPKPGAFANMGQYTSLNPASIAWEAMPWTFVVDWVVDIGSYIRNAETAALYGGALSSTFSSTVRGGEGAGNAYGTVTVSGIIQTVSAQAKMKSLRFDRSLHTGLPMPRLPLVNPSLGTNRLFSAAALLRVQMDRIQRKFS